MNVLSTLFGHNSKTWHHTSCYEKENLTPSQAYPSCTQKIFLSSLEFHDQWLLFSCTVWDRPGMLILTTVNNSQAFSINNIFCPNKKWGKFYIKKKKKKKGHMKKQTFPLSSLQIFHQAKKPDHPAIPTESLLKRNLRILK